MKRHASLVPLSDDHHRALVLARRLQRGEREPCPSHVDALAHEVRAAFEADLEPHFRVEERYLFPALAAAGAAALSERALRDHARLRALVHGPWSSVTAAELGSLLEEHVRFEERVLFPEAEALLSETELAVVREATPGRQGRKVAHPR